MENKQPEKIQIQYLVTGKTKSKNLRTIIEIHKRLDTEELFVFIKTKRLVSFEKRLVTNFEQVFTLHSFMTLFTSFKHIMFNDKLQKEFDEFIDKYPVNETTYKIEYFLGKS